MALNAWNNIILHHTIIRAYEEEDRRRQLVVQNHWQRGNVTMITADDWYYDDLPSEVLEKGKCNSKGNGTETITMDPPLADWTRAVEHRLRNEIERSAEEDAAT